MSEDMHESILTAKAVLMLDGLLDEILANRRHRLCAVGELMTKLEEKDRAALDAILENSSVRATELRTVLLGRGHNVPAESLRRHRRRRDGAGCSCP
jgi:hypothetical protein